MTYNEHGKRIRSENLAGRIARKVAQGEDRPVMNAGLTYTVKHIQKGLTLLCNGAAFMKVRRVAVKVVALIAGLPLASCTMGDYGDCFVPIASPVGMEVGIPRWRVCHWSRISDWLSSSANYCRSDGVHGCECFVSRIEGVGTSGSVWVWFSPSFGLTTLFQAEGLTLECENETGAILEVKGFPAYCKGICLRGPFDISRVCLNDSLEYFYWMDVNTDRLLRNHCYSKMLPSFAGASELKYLELYFESAEDKSGSKIQVLDLSQFSELNRLEELKVSGDCLLSNTEKLLQNKSLQRISLQAGFEMPDYDVDCESIVKCCVDDASYDCFMKQEFRGVDRLEVELNLKEIRRWNIAGLARQHIKFLSISSKNCLISGMEAFREQKDLQWFYVSMEISK